MNDNVASRVRTLLSVALPQGRPSVGVVLVGLLVLWFSWPIIASLNPIWSTDYYSHGHAVLVLTAVLFVLELRRAPFLPFAPSYAGLGCLLLLILISTAGYASTTMLISQLALPLIWMAAIWSLAGVGIARRFVLPLGYLYLVVPAWDVLIEPSRRLTVFVISACIRAAGLPAFIDGDTIHVPAGSFIVRGGCGGLKFLLVALSLAAFLSLSKRRRLVPAAMLLASAVVCALIGNWLRVFITVLSGLSPENLAATLVTEYHLTFGWGLFVVAVVVPLVYIDRLIEQHSVATSPLKTEAIPYSGGKLAQRAAVTVTCAVLALGVWLTYRADSVLVADSSPATAGFLATEVEGWDRTQEWQDARLPVFVGAHTQAAWYANGTDRVGAFVAHYPSQSQGQEVVFAHNLPAGQAGAVVARRPAVAEPFQELEVSDAADRRRLVWVALRVAGKPATNELVAKLLQVGGVIRGRSDAQALVLTATCTGPCEDARSWLSQFAAAAAEPLFQQVQRPVPNP